MKYPNILASRGVLPLFLAQLSLTACLGGADGGPADAPGAADKGSDQSLYFLPIHWVDDSSPACVPGEATALRVNTLIHEPIAFHEALTTVQSPVYMQLWACDAEGNVTMSGEFKGRLEAQETPEDEPVTYYASGALTLEGYAEDGTHVIETTPDAALLVEVKDYLVALDEEATATEEWRQVMIVSEEAKPFATAALAQGESSILRRNWGPAWEYEAP